MRPSFTGFIGRRVGLPFQSTTGAQVKERSGVDEPTNESLFVQIGYTSQLSVEDSLRLVGVNGWGGAQAQPVARDLYTHALQSLPRTPYTHKRQHPRKVRTVIKRFWILNIHAIWKWRMRFFSWLITACSVDE